MKFIKNLFTKKNITENSISVIHPYKHGEMWVFDDDTKGLDKEPFVAGADTLLTMLSPSDKCSLVFSKNNFPGAQHMVKKIGKGVGGGTDYLYLIDKKLPHILWLCPALLKYFSVPPEEIYFQIK